MAKIEKGVLSWADQIELCWPEYMFQTLTILGSVAVGYMAAEVSRGPEPQQLSEMERGDINLAQKFRTQWKGDAKNRPYVEKNV